MGLKFVAVEKRFKKWAFTPLGFLVTVLGATLVFVGVSVLALAF